MDTPDDSFAPFSLLAFLTGTLVYAFCEFHAVLLNANNLKDGRTGHMTYGEGRPLRTPAPASSRP